MAGLTAKGLGAFGLAMLAIANQRVEVRICDPEVRALSVGTGEAFGGYPSGELHAGFSPHARGEQDQELALHPTRE